MVDVDVKPPAAGAQSLRRALALLRQVAAAQEQGIRLVDLVAATGLNRPTVHRMLQVLREESVVEQDLETRRYKIGPELALLGMARGDRFPIGKLAEPYLQQVSQKVGDTVFLTVRQGRDSVGIRRITGHYPIQVLATEVGVRRPLGAGVAGVAILATLPAGEATTLVHDNARRLATLGITPAAMEQRIARARTEGYAWAPVGLVPGTSAISVAVVGGDGQAVAAVSVAAMATRLSRERLMPVVAALLDAARQIAKRSDDVKKARRRG
jgi:DNA-binding IclR family transcriptional regulator